MNAPLTAEPPQQAALEPRPRLWTRDEYYRMADLTFFHGQRAELMEGVILVMSPQNFLHGVTVDAVTDRFKVLFASVAWVRTQLSMDFGPFSEPEPDISIVPGKRQDYTDHPTTALLLVEVSETTLAYDRGRKASLYARTGIPDYWIINLVDRQIEVYRTPVADASAPYGYRYADKAIKKGSETLAPLTLPGAALTAAALLP